jgi:hypothetical protein
VRVTMSVVKDTKENISRLTETISGLGFKELFFRQDRSAVDLIWKESRDGIRLERIIKDSNAEPLTRFLSAEIMFSKNADFPTEDVKPVLVKVYATALKENFTGLANPWGLPGKLDGETAQHFVKLGPKAVTELVRLLDDNTGAMYGGSKEATFGNSYHYRVKDLAAFFIAKIRGIPLKIDKDPKLRDIEIGKLKASLEKTENLG